MDKRKLITFTFKIIIIAIIFYLIYPKYEFYQSSDGTLPYRFNKITGNLESSITTGEWEKTIPHNFIKKP